MSNEEAMTTRDKLEKILRLADELLIEMDEDIEESNEEPRKRVRGLGYIGEKPAKQGTRWSTADDDYLRLMLAAGWELAKIASLLERTIKSVEQRPATMKRMGIW
jgi:hypothetical protein